MKKMTVRTLLTASVAVLAASPLSARPVIESVTRNTQTVAGANVVTGCLTLQDEELGLKPYKLGYVSFELTAAPQGEAETMTFVLVPVTDDTFDFSEGETCSQEYIRAIRENVYEYVAGKDPKDSKNLADFELLGGKRPARVAGTLCLPIELMGEEAVPGKKLYRWYLPVATTEVTWGQYYAVTGTTGEEDRRSPVDNLSDAEITRFLGELNTKMGKVLSQMWAKEARLTHQFHFRLPTDEEWEFAARGGRILGSMDENAYLSYAKNKQGAFDNDENLTGKLRWVMGGQGGNEDRGVFNANLYCNYCGLYDILGNAQEIVGTPYALGDIIGSSIVRGCTWEPADASRRTEEVKGITSRKGVGFRLVIGTGILGAVRGVQSLARDLGSGNMALLYGQLRQHCSAVSNPQSDSQAAELQSLRESELKSRNVISDLHKQIDKQQKELERCRQNSRMAQSAKELEQELERCKNEVAELKKQLEKSSKGGSAAAPRTQDTELTNTRQKVRQLQEENARYRKRMEELGHFEKRMQEEVNRCQNMMNYLARILVREVHNNTLLAMGCYGRIKKDQGIIERLKSLPDNERNRQHIQNAQVRIDHEHENIVTMYRRVAGSLDYFAPIDRQMVEDELARLLRQVRQADSERHLPKTSLDRQTPVTLKIQEEISSYLERHRKPSLREWEEGLKTFIDREYTENSPSLFLNRHKL